MSISEYIEKTLNEKFGGNQTKMAAALGVSSQRIGQYISKRSEPKPSFYEKWQNAFNENLYEIIVSKKATSKEDFEMRLIRIEANLEVFQIAIAGLKAKRKEDFSRRFSELQSLIEEAYKRRVEL